MSVDDYLEQISIDGNWSPDLRRKYIRDSNQSSKNPPAVKDSERKPIYSNEELFTKAAFEGNLKTLLNLHTTVPINTQNSRGQTALILACIGGNANSVQFLLAKQANKEICDETGNSAYHHACLKDDPTIFKILLEKGDPNFKNRNGQTVLHFAIKNEKYKILDFLLASEKININEKDNEDNTAAHLAIIERNSKVLSKLVKTPLNLSLFNKNGLNPINLAIQRNDLDSLKILLTTKEGIKLLLYKTQYKESNFQIAVRLKFTTIVDYLMSIKTINLVNADIDEKYGYTCLHWATLQINKELVDKILKANQTLIHVKDKMEMTAFDHIVNIYDKSKTVQSDIIAIALNLLIHDADPYLVGNRTGFQKLLKEICLMRYNT